MKFSFKRILPIAALALSSLAFTSCVGDLDVDNINPQQESEFNQKAVFNKIYANLAITGITGPDGSGDLDGIDEGFSSFTRLLWNAQELPTDEFHCSWGDAGIPEWNHNSWSDSHNMMNNLYYRIYFGITVANFFMEQTDGASDSETLVQRAEARFLRAYYYSQLCDLFGNVPFTTVVSSEKPQQTDRVTLYNWVVSELKDVIGEGEGNEVLADTPVQYGRATKTAAYMLLSRMYLNSQVYTGTARWQEAKDYAELAITNGAYHLNTTGNNGYTAYQLLFMGDNDSNGAQNENVLVAIQDGDKTQTWGGAMFLIAAASNADTNGDYPTGTSEGWGGVRARPQFVQKFFPNNDAPVGTPNELRVAADDDRALFYSKDHTLDITDESDFKKGYAYIKFLNTHSDGGPTSDGAAQYIDTDVPLLRLAEAYLISAEADARLNGGTCSAQGIARIKALRDRANAYSGFSTFTLDQIEDEWARELAYECVRRTTLIRFGHFGGQNDYKWQWMGGVYNGAPFDAHYNIYAIPVSDLNANNNLVQNPGY